MFIGIGTLIALKIRAHKQQQKYHQQHSNQKYSRPGNLQIKDKISLPISHSEEMYDEKNPDVVPYNEGKCELYLLYFSMLYTIKYYTTLLHCVVVDSFGRSFIPF